MIDAIGDDIIVNDFTPFDLDIPLIFHDHKPAVVPGY